MDSDADRVALLEDEGGEVRWIARAQGSLLDAVRALALPAGETYWWAAGESAVVRELHRHLVQERGVHKKRIRASSYWRRGDGAVDETLEDWASPPARTPQYLMSRFAWRPLCFVSRLSWRHSALLLLFSCRQSTLADRASCLAAWFALRPAWRWSACWVWAMAADDAISRATAATGTKWTERRRDGRVKSNMKRSLDGDGHMLTAQPFSGYWTKGHRASSYWRRGDSAAHETLEE